MNRKTSGFTLLELLAVVTIAGLLLAVAVPGMRAFIQNGRMTGAANDLVHALQTTRTEAIKRRRNVVMCTSADPLEEEPACDDEAALNGWFIFVDNNADGIWDAASVVDVDGDGDELDEDANDNGIEDAGEDAAGDNDGTFDQVDAVEAEVILLQHAPLDGGITAGARLDDGDETDFVITYDSTGFLTGTDVSAVVMCDARGNTASFGELSAARGVTISATGRVATTRGIEEIEDLGGC